MVFMVLGFFISLEVDLFVFVKVVSVFSFRKFFLVLIVLVIFLEIVVCFFGFCLCRLCDLM